jgi:ATP-dependent helicase HrpB
MLPLPIDDVLPGLLQALRTHEALVLVAPPGAGKTTRVPPAIIRENILPNDAPNLIMLQPRRVAARASAERIAAEQSWTLGNEVGYHIRFDKRYAPHTRIRVLTEAILTRMLLADASLDGIGCVILDEFHERNLHTDLALAFLREVQQTIRPDLKIIVMSATLDARPVAAFLGNCPILHSEGRLFPIDITYRPPRDRPLDAQVAAAVDDALNGEGDVLVFLPGIGEIDRAARALSILKSQISNLAVLPLHGSLSPEDQQKALRPAKAGERKIILATNIAETSLTIDGIRTVIDSGLARVASFDAGRGMDRLDLSRISKASATQRAGRAGRQAPGRAIRLWPELEQKHLPDFTPPEIHRVDLASAILAVHAWGAKNPREFAWFDPPEEPVLAAAENLLTQLGALHAGALTDRGRQMLQFPAHPRIARLLIAAVNTPHLEDALSLAAILSDDSRAPRPPSATARADGTRSPAQRLDILTDLQRIPPHLTRARDQFAAIARSLTSEISNLNSGISNLKSEISNLKSQILNPADLLLLAYPDRIARRRSTTGDAFAAVMVGNTGLRLAPESLTPAIAQSELFLALDVHHDPRSKRAEAAVRTALPLDRATLERLFPEDFRTETALEYDEQKQKVTAFTREFFADLLLREDPHGKIDPVRAGKVLATALAPRAAELFTQNEPAAKLLARTALLRQFMPEHPWPAFDEPQLQQLLREAAATEGGKRTLAELTEGPALANALRNALPYPLDRLLDQHAPETIEVPTGNKIKLQYAQIQIENRKSKIENVTPPILAVRLQELFGLLDTPRIANGRVPILLHLLSPGYKPMQITSDLRSFWKTAYFEVRKDLRAQYPKHKWPEDPLTATPEAKGRPRR